MARSEDFDIREAAKLLEPAVFFFNKLEEWDLAERCILLRQYIMDTWEMEQQLENRADYIQTETFAVNELLREIRAKLMKDAELEGEEGPDVENDGGAGTDSG